ncbi:LeoA/HP0731 family dynamin-like GTPase [Azospirillum sp.]|uniref:LeoA/HP0731 family dynamin-like GTPase n=1 Tax=Azospirillum sp. TaxID=34012 RepID=UPI002D4BF996|nr:LeoA/HP0731 family dynamin-like GTPase [Azospirillum sp.]HYF87920.1 LeoA/HP0731 family dynamin-like GTPase [Azospirillum sp.]
MENFDRFRMGKSATLAYLSHLKQMVAKMSGVGMDTFEDIAKIDSAVRDIEDDVLRIALIGAFSDGKTSVVAGWLGRVMDNMKIDTDESSDRLAVYRPDSLPDRCEIIDTPGLFGDKEKTNSVGNVVQYGDITREYLSSAHLIFYVVDATNPLKDSHKDTVRWILRDLGKLSSTVFVINKMDEVADLRDEDDFTTQSSIKRVNLLDKLDRFLELTDAERQAVNIVCIASNPNNRGLEYWFSKMEAYEERSRIYALKAMTASILDRTTRETLSRKTGMDVMKDILHRKVAMAAEEFTRFQLMSDALSEDTHRITEDIERGKRRILAAKRELLEELDSVEKALLGKIRGLGREDIVPFLEDEVGYSGGEIGYKLQLKIEMACQRSFEQSTAILGEISVSIERQLETSSRFAETVTSSALAMSSTALKHVSTLPVETIRAGVFAARDMLASVTGMTIKFKPWGATKLAGSIGKWAGTIGAGIQILGDVVDAVRQQRAQEELAELKKDLSEMVKEHFKIVYNLLRDDGKVLETFAPQIKIFEDILERQRADLAGLLAKRQMLEAIRRDLEEASATSGILEGGLAIG